jgi:hypothetical protein
MESNIFLKNSTLDNKYNPDVITKLSSEKTIRNNTNYNMTNVIYNPITGIVPQQVQSSKDLILEKDKQMGITNFNKLMLSKKQEREGLCVSNTIVQKSNTVVQESEITNTQKTIIPNVDRSNYIQTFEELKNPQRNNVQRPVNNTNVINQLKDLGIFY